MEVTNFTSNTFRENKAKGSGGAIYLISLNTILFDNKFIKNIAGVGGKVYSIK